MIAAAILAVAGQLAILPTGAEQYPVSQALGVLQEPPIDAVATDVRVFRFVWIPPFPSMRLFSVRIEDVGHGPRMVAKTARWTYDPSLGLSGSVERTLQRQLSAEVWADLAALRHEGGFWTFNPEAFPQPVHDGSVWVLEGAAWGERLRVVQHVPGPSQFKTLCRRMLALFNPRLTDAESSLEHE